MQAAVAPPLKQSATRVSVGRHCRCPFLARAKLALRPLRLFGREEAKEMGADLCATWSSLMVGWLLLRPLDKWAGGPICARRAFNLNNAGRWLPIGGSSAGRGRGSSSAKCNSLAACLPLHRPAPRQRAQVAPNWSSRKP